MQGLTTIGQETGQPVGMRTDNIRTVEARLEPHNPWPARRCDKGFLSRPSPRLGTTCTDFPWIRRTSRNEHAAQAAHVALRPERGRCELPPIPLARIVSATPHDEMRRNRQAAEVEACRTDDQNFAATGADGVVHVRHRGGGGDLGDCDQWLGPRMCNDALRPAWSTPAALPTSRSRRPRPRSAPASVAFASSRARYLLALLEKGSADPDRSVVSEPARGALVL